MGFGACGYNLRRYLDDNSLNVEAAQSFGMHAIRVLGAHEARRALTDLGIIESDA